MVSDDAPAVSGVLQPSARLVPVDVRKVWPHEAHDFTPWMLANADVLGDELGMDLVLKAAEHAVGDFQLDLIGVDEATNDLVIVENQLSPTDHSHLGQLLTYAGGTAATNIVWMATAFRDEHRAALEWLNTRTGEDARFFGVEIRAVRIGNSPPAPLFRLVVQPNDWGKQVKQSNSPTSTARNLAFQQFWTRFLDRVHAKRPGWTKARKAPAQNWLEMPTGVTGYAFSVSFARQGLRSEIYLGGDAATNQRILQLLTVAHEQLESTYGEHLEFEPLDGKIASRVAAYHQGDIDTTTAWDDYLDWFLHSQTQLRAALATLGGLPALHKQATTANDASNPE